MAATLTSILLHVTYSTKNRKPFIPLDVLPELFAYSGGICRDVGSRLFHAGGVSDHVHLLVDLNKTMAVSDVMRHVKRGSSAWMKHRVPDFGWQDGYFAFSVGHGSVDAVRAYFDRQQAHHRRASFQEEVLGFLQKYAVEFDARYIWD